MKWRCENCGNDSYDDGGDGYFYCGLCLSQAEGIMNTGINDEDLLNDRPGSMYHGSHKRVRQTPVTTSQAASQVKLSQSQQFDLTQTVDDAGNVNAGDGVGPTGPSDFGSSSVIYSYEDYYLAIRLRYVMGFHFMIQMQCKALVENFDASPQIQQLVTPIWLRFLAYTRVMADEWADEVLHESETQNQGEVDELKHTTQVNEEPHNMYGQRAVMIWIRSLRSLIPLSYSLAISFLICHVARESVLPTDILKWALDGKIPYFAAYVEIEKQLGPPTSSCPFSSSVMFRPTHFASLQRLESMAAFVAQKIGLDLPPVNFNAIASRYLRDLSLPVSEILPQVSRIYEWSKHPDLCLSTNALMLPSRVRVMSILIVLIRILYNLNGFGVWESTLSSSDVSPSLVNLNRKREDTSDYNIESDASSHKSSSGSIHDIKSKGFRNPGSSPREILQILERKYRELSQRHGTYDHSDDLFSYLQYCQNTVFAGTGSSFEDRDEEKLIEDFWEYYQNHKGSEPPEEEIGSPEDGGMCTERRALSSESVRLDCDEFTCDTIKDDAVSHEGCSLQSSPSGCYSPHRDGCTIDKSKLSEGSYKERAIRELKSNMEENKFCYIPPSNVKREDYICYSRKRNKGMFLYVAHADYYILLRCCAALAEVDARTMHMGVLSFERRLEQLLLAYETH